MGRQKAEQPTMTIRQIHEELIHSHGWNAAGGHIAETSQQKIIEVAARLGITCADAWTPTLTVAQARDLLHAIVTEQDPEDRALNREIAERHETKTTLQIRLGEVVSELGMRAAGAMAQFGVPQLVHAYGPGEPSTPPGVDNGPMLYSYGPGEPSAPPEIMAERERIFAEQMRDVR